MQKKFFILAATLALLSAVFTGCNNTSQTTTRSDFALDTVVTITLYGTDDASLLDAPFQKIYELADKLDAFSDTSEVTAINNAAGVEPVAVSDETFEVIQKGIEYGYKTDGAFDITIGPLTELWHIGSASDGKVPEQAAVDAAKALVDYQKVTLDSTAKTVYLQESGMKLNLGAIAKGYIGDAVKAILLDEGVQNAVINLGGNVVLIGGRTHSQPFSVGVQDPESEDGVNLGVIETTDQSIVTSGDYERYMTASDGTRYHHILDPKTGYPADSGLHQTTVLCDSSTDADAMSTSFFIMGYDQVKEKLSDFGNPGVLFVTTDNHIEQLGNIREVFTLNTEMEKNYTFEE